MQVVGWHIAASVQIKPKHGVSFVVGWNDAWFARNVRIEGLSGTKTGNNNITFHVMLGEECLHKKFDWHQKSQESNNNTIKIRFLQEIFLRSHTVPPSTQKILQLIF